MAKKLFGNVNIGRQMMASRWGGGGAVKSMFYIEISRIF